MINSVLCLITGFLAPLIVTFLYMGAHQLQFSNALSRFGHPAYLLYGPKIREMLRTQAIGGYISAAVCFFITALFVYLAIRNEATVAFSFTIPGFLFGSVIGARTARAEVARLNQAIDNPTVLQRPA
jgi:hypothetical protein